MNTHSRYLADFNVAGMRYWDGALVLSKLEPGEKLQLIAEPQYLHDSDAAAICYKSNKIGYIPQDFNFFPAQLLRFGHKNVLECRVLKVDKSADPWRQLRVGLYITDRS